ncbi:MAG: alpha/beta hydrolase, partial [Oscillospiraceae bacterium]
MTVAIAIVLGAALTLVLVGAGVFWETIVRTDRSDHNYDGVSDETAFLPSGGTDYRIVAAAGNIWWNKQPLERIVIKSDDGLLLVGHILRAPAPSRGLAFVAHGHQCVSGEMGFIAQMYIDRGLDVFIADQRAHGKSGGRFIGMGLPESRDMLRWLPAALEKAGQPKNVVLHGISMGAETVMLMSAQPLPECVRCAVEDCGYSTAYGAILNVVRKSYRAVPFKVIAVEIASIINRLVCGFSFRDIAAVRAVEKSAVPMLFIHGDADRTVPVQMVYEL